MIVQTYDPLNRVITRAVNGAITQNVWEGWNLIEEHRPDWSIQRCYLQGANQNEMVAAFDGGVYTTHWFWQDGRGNMSHITGDNAALLERYTYDLSGAPKFYDEWGNERFGGSVYDARFLFAGSQYLPETGLYDMRNRFYSPALSRFLQTDPIGFAGDALNLYRYCGDDPVDRSDPMGLQDHPIADIVWQMACHMDSGNMLQGTFQDLLKRLQPAGMDGGNVNGGGVENGGGGGGGTKPMAPESEGKKQVGNVQDSAKPRPKYTIERTSRGWVTQGEHGPIAHIIWYYTVSSPAGNSVARVRIDENVSYHDGVCEPPKGPNEPHWTDAYGHAKDNYRIPFSCANGSVIVRQELIIGSAKGVWETKVGANGSITPQNATMDLD